MAWGSCQDTSEDLAPRRYRSTVVEEREQEIFVRIMLCEIEISKTDNRL